MGRKWAKDGSKKSRLGLRLSTDERISLEEMAKQEKRTPSEMMRALIREGAQNRSIQIVVGELSQEGVIE